VLRSIPHVDQGTSVAERLNDVDSGQAGFRQFPRGDQACGIIAPIVIANPNNQDAGIHFSSMFKRKK
jgi:hypothetical protein